jgi:hypothetical protein
MEFTLKEAIEVVKKHEDELPFSKQQKNAYVKFLDSQIERQKGDLLEAVKLAVDVSKTLVAIATGFFVAVGAFMQYGLQQGLAGSSHTSIALYCTGVFLLLSMAFGIKVTGDAYNRGAGIIEGPPWDVRPLRGLLLVQIVTGMLACGAFAYAVSTWERQAAAVDEENKTDVQLRFECKEGVLTREQGAERRRVYVCG